MRREMGATYILPMHHSTFRLSREPVREPITRLIKVAGDEQWRIALGEPGETWIMPEEETYEHEDESILSLTATAS